MTLLGTIATDPAEVHKGPAYLITLCGARYEGVQRTGDGRDLVLFTDPVTRSTTSLWADEVTIGTVWRKLAEVRARWRS